MNILYSFVGSLLGGLVAWFVIFHLDLEGRWQSWRYVRGRKMTKRQERLAREHISEDASLP